MKKLVKIYIKNKNLELYKGLKICLKKIKKIKKENSLQKEEKEIQLDKNKMNIEIEKEINKYKL